MSTGLIIAIVIVALLLIGLLVLLPRMREQARLKARERELQQRLFESDDAKEGLAANLEKRTPKFAGR